MKIGRPLINLKGKSIGRWTILYRISNKRKDETYWLCKCQCGQIKEVAAASLNKGYSLSCGCYKIEQTIKSNTKHGETVNYKTTPEYICWRGMKARCLNPKATGYKNYGGRGITIYFPWINSYYLFLSYILISIGRRPSSEYSLDRIDVNGNYEPGNLRWATNKEQQQSRRIAPKTKNYEVHETWKQSMVSIIGAALRNNCSYPKFEKYIGCSLPEFKKYIESKFQKGMIWSNRGPNRKNKKNWQISHIKSSCNFDLSIEEDRLICFNYKNLQPLWWKDNCGNFQ